MKYSAFLLLMVFSTLTYHYCLASAELNKQPTKPTVKLCLTGTTVKLVPEYGQAFLNGSQLAVNRAKPSQVNFMVEEHFYDPTPLAPRRALENMIKAKCSVVLGFSNSNDLLAIKKLAQDSKILIISMYAQKNESLKDIDHMLTMQTTPQNIVEDMGRFLRSGSIVLPKKVLIATTVDRDSMNQYKKDYSQLFDKLQVKYDHVDLSERAFNPEHFENAFLPNKSNYDAVLILSRAVTASNVTKIITKHLPIGKRPLILGTANFGSAQLPAFLNRLEDKNITAYLVRQNRVNDPTPSYQSYVSAYKNTFKKEPMVISGLAYDATDFVIQSSQKLLAQDIRNVTFVPSHQLTNAAKVTRYSGMTGVIFNKGFKTLYTKSFVVKVDSTGYHGVKILKASE